jgi:hypothetical protein
MEVNCSGWGKKRRIPVHLKLPSPATQLIVHFACGISDMAELKWALTQSALVSKTWQKQLSASLISEWALRAAKWKLSVTSHLIAIRLTALKNEEKKEGAATLEGFLQSNAVIAGFIQEREEVDATLGSVLYAIQKYHAPVPPSSATPASLKILNMWLAMDPSELSGLARKELTAYFDENISDWGSGNSARSSLLALSPNQSGPLARLL